MTSATIVACTPQIRTLFLKRFKTKNSQENARGSIIATHQDFLEATSKGSRGGSRGSEIGMITPANGLQSNEKRAKSTPLVLSNKYLRGDGKVGVGDARLPQSRHGENEET
jgi:hypothetical protein